MDNKMEKIINKKFTGERALFTSKDLYLEKCGFMDGESPLKESQNLELKECVFFYKYPLWYTKDVKMNQCTLKDEARSGLWYVDKFEMNNCQIETIKTFRRSKNITVNNTKFLDAKETMWNCENVKLFYVHIKGDYFGINCKNVEADNLVVEGNYIFDGSENVTVRNSYLESKDAFWNCKNVTLINCTIIGEYLGWNTENLTLINCKIESHQGLCYINKLTMYHCEVTNSDLTFEYSKDINAEITTVVDSIKNPINGQIVVKDVKELILDRNFINPAKTKIIKR